MKLARIDSIDPGDAATWSESLFVSLDLDWCHDDVLAQTLDLLESHDAAATLFVTHDTPLLSRMRANPRLELGIHPNFNPLLAGSDSRGATCADVIQRCLDVVPEARSVRSHSLVQSTSVLRAFADAGLTYDCNTYIGRDSGIALAPIRHFFGGLVRVPHCFEDDIEVTGDPTWDVDAVVDAPGLRVLDFHPIHIFLNTESIERYERARPHHDRPEQLRDHANTEAPGTRSLFEAILGAAQRPAPTPR